VLKGTPEIFTDIYNINLTVAHVLKSSPKGIKTLCYFLSPHFIYSFTQHAFCVNVVDCILLARHSDQGFDVVNSILQYSVVNSILQYSCATNDKELFDKTELL